MKVGTGVHCYLRIVILIVCALVVSGCSSSGKSPTTNAVAFVNVRVSDPATCSSPKGAFSHIYVTITDVQINASANATRKTFGKRLSISARLSRKTQVIRHTQAWLTRSVIP